ncbi:MAG: FimV/HubP family polar landmark protein, partial [bacterium]
ASPAPRAPSPAPRAPSPAPRASSPAPLALDMEKTQILQLDDTALSEAPPTIDFDFEPAGALAPPAAGAGVGGLMDVGGAAVVPSGAAATDMDFTLDFGSPQTASAPPLPDLPLEAPSVGTQTAEADLTFEPIFPSSTGEEGLPTPLFQSEATNVLLDSGPPTGSILDFKREAALAQSELSAADTESGEPTQASLGQDTMIMANPGELVTFDMTHPAGLPQNWQEATLPRVDLDLGETQVDGSNPDRDEHWNDVNTKCDLAKAYEEMGDKDGAREILREVIAEGDAQQKADAEAMLARLG